MTMADKSNDSNQKKFKTTKLDGFGASKTNEMKVGDIVSWASWAEALDTEVFEEKNGILTQIYVQERTEGWTYMAKILPFGENKEITIPLIVIKKSTLNN
jgi:hypothetical protein